MDDRADVHLVDSAADGATHVLLRDAGAPVHDERHLHGRVDLGKPVEMDLGLSLVEAVSRAYPDGQGINAGFRDELLDVFDPGKKIGFR